MNELPENEKDQDIDFDSVDRENVHNILNSPITEEEICELLKILKSNKASGYDDIVNEHDYGKGLNNLDLYTFIRRRNLQE